MPQEVPSCAISAANTEVTSSKVRGTPSGEASHTVRVISHNSQRYATNDESDISPSTGVFKDSTSLCACPLYVNGVK